MSKYDKIVIPAGDRIVNDNGCLQVPDQPIVGFITGDGVGPDITGASMHIWALMIFIRRISLIGSCGCAEPEAYIIIAFCKLS